MIFKTVTLIQKSEEMLRLCSAEQSRRDVTLLTVGFNLRKLYVHIRCKSRRDGTIIPKCRPCGTWSEYAASFARRLKSTVNQVLSLRDISPLTQSYDKLFIFHPLISFE